MTILDSTTGEVVGDGGPVRQGDRLFGVRRRRPAHARGQLRRHGSIIIDAESLRPEGDGFEFAAHASTPIGDGSTAMVYSDGNDSSSEHLRVVDLSTGDVLAEGDLDLYLYASVASPDGSTVAVAGNTGEIVTIDVSTGDEQRRSTSLGAEVLWLNYSDDGELLVSGGDGRWGQPVGRHDAGPAGHRVPTPPRRPGPGWGAVHRRQPRRGDRVVRRQGLPVGDRPRTGHRLRVPDGRPEPDRQGVGRVPARPALPVRLPRRVSEGQPRRRRWSAPPNWAADGSVGRRGRSPRSHRAAMTSRCTRAASTASCAGTACRVWSRRVGSALRARARESGPSAMHRVVVGRLRLWLSVMGGSQARGRRMGVSLCASPLIHAKTVTRMPLASSVVRMDGTAWRARRRSRPRYPRRPTCAPPAEWRRHRTAGPLPEPLAATRGCGSLRPRGPRSRLPSGPLRLGQPPSRPLRSQRSREPAARPIGMRLPRAERGHRGRGLAPLPTLRRADSRRPSVPGRRNKGCRYAPGGGCPPK